LFYLDDDDYYNMCCMICQLFFENFFKKYFLKKIEKTLAKFASLWYINTRR